jgi:DNA-binding transcriptional ArsR family regulator
MARPLPYQCGMKRQQTITHSPVNPFPSADLPGSRFRPSVPVETRTETNGRLLNKFFKALSDETRREILRLLEAREHTVGEIVDRFTLSQPTISRHLSVLKEANLVTDQRKGQFVIYRLSGMSMARSARQFFDEFKECRQEDPT